MPVERETIKVGPATYLLDRRIGKSSHGEVWRAHLVTSGTPVAIKFVRNDDPSAAQAEQHDFRVAAMRREIAFLSRIRGPHIVQCHRHGEHCGLPVVVLEALDSDLHVWVRAGEPRVDLGQALEWMRQIAEGLRIIHRLGHCHLDLKPGNLLLTPPGPLGRQIRIADFGTTQALGEASVRFRGTPGWQAPEQFFPLVRENGDFIYRVDARSDLYALGLLLFFIVTGQTTGFARAAARIFREGREQAAWNARSCLDPRLTTEDSERFLAALGDTPVGAMGVDEDEGTWLPSSAHRCANAAIVGMQQPLNTPTPDAGQRALELVEALLTVDPQARPATIGDALERIHSAISKGADLMKGIAPGKSDTQAGKSCGPQRKDGRAEKSDGFDPSLTRHRPNSIQ